MFGIPGEVFWPTAAFASIVILVMGGIALLRYLPQARSRVALPDAESLTDLQTRVTQLETLQERVGELEERLDFAERLLAKQREAERLPPARE